MKIKKTPLVKNSIYPVLFIKLSDFNNIRLFFHTKKNNFCYLYESPIRKLFLSEDKKLEKFLSDLINEATSIINRTNDTSHNIYHSLRVYKNSCYISKIYYNSFTILTKLAAWWHDTGRIYGNNKHEINSVILLRNQLKNYDINSNYLTHLEKAIRNHKFSMIPLTLEGNIVRDADKLDFLSEDRWQDCINNYNNLSEIEKKEFHEMLSLCLDIKKLLMLNCSKQLSSILFQKCKIQLKKILKVLT